MRELLIAFIILVTGASMACAQDANDTVVLQAKIVELQKQVDTFKAEKELVAKNIALFEELDLVAFNNRDVKRISEIHRPDVKVINPNGSVTEGFDPKLKEGLQWLFGTFSDCKIVEHPVKFGAGDWTAGISISEGTWNKPMVLPDGSVLQPTGNRFRIKSATIALWKDGRIVQKYLFWDNEDFNKQIGP